MLRTRKAFYFGVIYEAFRSKMYALLLKAEHPNVLIGEGKLGLCGAYEALRYHRVFKRALPEDCCFCTTSRSIISYNRARSYSTHDI